MRHFHFPANMTIWVPCVPHVGQPLATTWGPHRLTIWGPHKFGRGFLMVPTWASPSETIWDACGFQMGPIWAYVYAYHVGPTWFLHGTVHLKLYGTHVGYRWVPYGPAHVPHAWVPDGFHMGQPTCATYGSQMGYMCAWSILNYMGTVWVLHGPSYLQLK